MSTVVMESHDVLSRVVTLPRRVTNLRGVGNVAGNRRCSYTVIFGAAMPHSGQLNRSNSIRSIAGLLSSKPISMDVSPFLFTVKSPAAQLLIPTREEGSVGTAPSTRELLPERHKLTPVTEVVVEFVQPPLEADPFTDCSPAVGYVYRVG